MNAPTSTSARFRLARKSAGLSIDEMTIRAGISIPCLWDLENIDEELAVVYSAADVQRFASIFSIAPRDLLGTEGCDPPVSVGQLASSIRDYCSAPGITVDQFGDVAGWDVTEAVDAPELLLTDFPIEGIKNICTELGIDWQRFVSGL